MTDSAMLAFTTDALADIPERRQDLVDGNYTVVRPAGSTRPVAVRITDMLGEEILVIEPGHVG